MAIFSTKNVLANRDAQIALTLYRIGQAIETMVRKRGEAEGLSTTQVQTLLYVSNAHPSCRTIGAVARKLLIAPATATRVVDTLEGKSLVQRVRQEEDRRTVRVELTEGGACMVEEISDIGDMLEELVEELPSKGWETLLEGLKHVLKGMQEKGYITGSVICRICPFFQPDAYPEEGKPHHCNLTGEALSEEESYMEWLSSCRDTKLKG